MVRPLVLFRQAVLCLLEAIPCGWQRNTTTPLQGRCKLIAGRIQRFCGNTIPQIVFWFVSQCYRLL